MKTAQFTPGPWAYERNKAQTTESERINIVAGDVLIAETHHAWMDWEEQEANATLIAAAPAMYEALKDLIGDLGDLHGGSIAELQCHWCGRDYEDEEAGGLCTSDDCPGYIARQAIAQAEGRHPRKEETCK